jgi:4,5-dihydroxyphthalate decarboxylase
LAVAVRLGLRDWDWATPLLLGDVKSDRIDLTVVRLAALPDDFATDAGLDASEISFSRYTSARARGDERICGVPNFIMRAFRHRCVITRADSPVTTFAALKGGRIGLAGWQDSGNTWTRAALRAAGVGLGDARWLVSRLSAKDPAVDRLGPFAQPGLIENIPGQPPLLELLAAGELDAVLLPFMPPGFFSPGSAFRLVLPDVVAAEQAYFRETGFVPGIHILGVKSGVAAQHPWLAQALGDLIDEAQRVWLEKRRRYADTTPWLIDELVRSGKSLPESWNASGLAANRAMIGAFLGEMRVQRLADTDLTPDTLFPAFS